MSKPTATDWTIVDMKGGRVLASGTLWQPIGTAPKDGSDVDLWVPGRGLVPNARWIGGESPFWADGYLCFHEDDPTHWMSRTAEGCRMMSDRDPFSLLAKERISVDVNGLDKILPEDSYTVAVTLKDACLYCITTWLEPEVAREFARQLNLAADQAEREKALAKPLA